ncbi:hypothetical protein K9M79_05360 [Candidatus Woesearchaeota archaeon]|nr:hypothetical protein [Candidatus Woesearchaeota archaeon]
MGLDKLNQEIESSARKKVRTIKAKTKSEIDKILNDTHEEIRLAKEETKSLLIKEGAKEMKSRIASADNEAEKLLLMTKRRLIDKAFELAIGNIKEQNNKDEILTALLSKARKEIDISVIYLNRANQINPNLVMGIEVREAKIIGGLIAENKDGSIRVDYSYETFMEQIKADCIQQVAGILFNN